MYIHLFLLLYRGRRTSPRVASTLNLTFNLVGGGGGGVGGIAQYGSSFETHFYFFWAEHISPNVIPTLNPTLNIFVWEGEGDTLPNVTPTIHPTFNFWGGWDTSPNVTLTLIPTLKFLFPPVLPQKKQGEQDADVWKKHFLGGKTSPKKI